MSKTYVDLSGSTRAGMMPCLSMSDLSTSSGAMFVSIHAALATANSRLSPNMSIIGSIPFNRIISLRKTNKLFTQSYIKYFIYLITSFSNNLPASKFIHINILVDYNSISVSRITTDM